LDVIIALFAFGAGFLILQGEKTGYWLGIIFATLSSIRWFLFMPGAPILAMTMIFVWVLVIYGLAVSGDYFDLSQRGRSLEDATTRPHRG